MEVMSGFTNYEKCEAIINWATEEESFDTNFVENLYNQLSEEKDLSEKQVKALDNIISKYCIEVEEWV